jgi:hypothetical protein
LWRRPRPKLGCGAKERERRCFIILLIYFASYLHQKLNHSLFQIRHMQTLIWKRNHASKSCSFEDDSCLKQIVTDILVAAFWIVTPCSDMLVSYHDTMRRDNPEGRDLHSKWIHVMRGLRKWLSWDMCWQLIKTFTCNFIALLLLHAHCLLFIDWVAARTLQFNRFYRAHSLATTPWYRVNGKGKAVPVL